MIARQSFHVRSTFHPAPQDFIRQRRTSFPFTHRRCISRYASVARGVCRHITPTQSVISRSASVARGFVAHRRQSRYITHRWCISRYASVARGVCRHITPTPSAISRGFVAHRRQSRYITHRRCISPPSQTDFVSLWLPPGGGCRASDWGRVRLKSSFIPFCRGLLPSRSACHRLAAARSRSGSDTAPWCHSLPSRRFATSQREASWARRRLHPPQVDFACAEHKLHCVATSLLRQQKLHCA